MTIDIGPGAVDRTDDDIWSYTVVLLDNPANATGTITSIEVWAQANITGLRVGIFYLVSGTTYKCRSSVTIGNVAAGAKRTFTAPDDFAALDVVAGDFIGSYFSGGNIEAEPAGDGQMYKKGEFIDPGDQADYEAFINTESLYGTGEEAALAAVRSLGYIIG